MQKVEREKKTEEEERRREGEEGVKGKEKLGYENEEELEKQSDQPPLAHVTFYTMRVRKKRDVPNQQESRDVCR